MSNPFFNPKKMANALINSQAPNLNNAMKDPVKFITTELQNRNPEMIGRLIQAWQNPQKILNDFYSSNPEMQKQVNAQLQGKPLKEQQDILIKEAEQAGINIKALASQFGISL